MYLFHLRTLQACNWTHFSKLHTNHFPPGYSIQVADEYGLVPEDYIHDLKQLSDVRYIQGRLFPILLFSKQLLRPFQVIVATSMVYDMIRIIPQQVRLSICKNDSTYLFSPGFSTFTGMFSIQTWNFGRPLSLTYEHSVGSGQNCISSISLSPYAVG